MSRNGSGVYTLPSNSFNPAVADTEIDASDWNDSADDLETALTESIASTGVTTTTADIPFAAGVTINNTGLKVYDTNASHTLAIVPGSDLGTNRTFTLTTGDANRTLSMAGNITLAGSLTSSGAFPITLTATAATSVTLPTSGTLATLAGSEALTNKTYNGNTFTAGTGTLTLGAGKTLTASNTLTFTGTDGSTVAFGDGGTPVYTSDLGAGVATFLATPSSANLRSALTDETGTGAAVFAGTPTFSSRINIYDTTDNTVLVLGNTNGGTHEKYWGWNIGTSGTTISFLLMRDSGSPDISCMQVTRSGTTCTGISFFAPTSITGALTPSQTAGIVGTTTNNSANAGSVGEFISSSVPIGSSVSLTSGNPADVTSISLTAGDWDVWGNVALNPDAGTTSTLNFGWISTTSATVPTVPNGGAFIQDGGSHAAGATYVYSIGQTRISLASTTTVYLSFQSAFAVSTMGAYGFIGARRRR